MRVVVYYTEGLQGDVLDLFRDSLGSVRDYIG